MRIGPLRVRTRTDKRTHNAEISPTRSPVQRSHAVGRHQIMARAELQQDAHCRAGPQAAAPCSGVSPMSSLQLTSCPRETRRRIRRHWLHHAAPCSGDSASPLAPEFCSPMRSTPRRRASLDRGLVHRTSTATHSFECANAKRASRTG